MKLEINKTYRCRNGATMKIHVIAADGTAYGRESPGAELIAYNAYSGDACVRERSGFDIIAPFPVDGPEMYHRLKTQYGREITVSSTELTQAASTVYEEAAPLYGPAADRLRLLAAAALRMIELAKVKPPPAKPLRNRGDIEDALLLAGLDPAKYLKPDPGAVHYTKEPRNVMCHGTAESSKQIAHQAAVNLSKLLSEDLSMSVNPILLRLWLVERWDVLAKLAHQIHDAK